MEEVKHWAESLKSGDNVVALIRHATDGTKNKPNVKGVVIENFQSIKKLIGKFGRKQLVVPYNDLSQVKGEINE